MKRAQQKSGLCCLAPSLRLVRGRQTRHLQRGTDYKLTRCISLKDRKQTSKFHIRIMVVVAPCDLGKSVLPKSDTSKMEHNFTSDERTMALLNCRKSKCWDFDNPRNEQWQSEQEPVCWCCAAAGDSALPLWEGDSGVGLNAAQHRCTTWGDMR